MAVPFGRVRPAHKVRENDRSTRKKIIWDAARRTEALLRRCSGQKT